MCYYIQFYVFIQVQHNNIINIALLTGWLQMTFFGYTPFYLYGMLGSCEL